MRVQLAASLAILAVAVGGAVLLQDPRFAPPPSGSDAERPAAGGPTTTTPVNTTPVTTTPATSAPAAAMTSLSSASSTATSSTPGTTPESTASDSVPSASPSEPATAAEIATSTQLYFGRPFETIHIPGTYQGVLGPATLRLQVLKPAGWSTFPLPVVTDASGRFRAYVELGAGRYRLRLVDPSTGTTSTEFELLLF